MTTDTAPVKKNVLDDDRIGLLLFKMTLPAFVGMSVITLYNVVNTIFVGRFVGSGAIAGLSIVFPIQMLGMGVGMMAGMGGASLISRLIGASNKQAAEKALGNALAIILLLSAIIIIAGLANTDFWLRLVGASEDIISYARDYLRIILFGMFLQTLAMSLNSLVISQGSARIAMTAQIIGAVANIILDAFFIILLGWGVKGAALGTVIAQLLSVIFFAVYFWSGKSYLAIRPKNFLFDWNIIKGILSIGISGMAMTLASSLSAVFVNRMLVTHGGSIAVSAFGILNRIMMFATMPGISIGQGLQPILGFNYGSRRFDRALKALKTAILSSTTLCLLAFLLLYFIPEVFIRIFTTESELIELSARAARYMFVTMYLVGFIMIGSTMFQALGKAKQAFLTSISRPFLFLFPLVLLLPHFFKLNGVWLAYPVTDFLTFIMVLILFVPQVKELSKTRPLTSSEVQLHRTQTQSYLK